MLKRTSRAHLTAFLAALLACAGVVLWMTGPFLLALFLGTMLAMLGNPCRRRLVDLGLGPQRAAFLTTLFMTVVIVGPLSGFSTMAVREALSLRRSLAGTRALSTDGMTQAIERAAPVRTLLGRHRAAGRWVEEALRGATEYAAAVAVQVTKGIPMFVLQIALALISCHFFLIDGERMARWLLGRSALDPDVQEALMSSFRDTAVSSVLAGLAAAACQAACISIGYTLLSVPRPFLAGAATFVLAWIPVVGSMPASAAGLLYLYFEGTPLQLALMAAVAVLAGVCDNLVRPLVLKGRDEMHPLVGLLAVIGGIDLFGILGLFIGPILAAILIQLLELWPSIGGRYGLELEARSP